MLVPLRLLGHRQADRRTSCQSTRIPLKHVQVWVCKAIDDSIWRFQDAFRTVYARKTDHFQRILSHLGSTLCSFEGYERTPGPRPSKYFVVPGYTGVNEVTVPKRAS